MGRTIYISDDLHGYLSQYTRFYSFDAVIKQLLHLDTFKGRIVKKQVSRENLAPLDIFHLPILSNINLPRKEMQKAVGDYLREVGHFDEYPEELVKMRNTQERWKMRFSNALNTLKKLGLIESENSGPKNWQGGGIYKTTPEGDARREELARQLPRHLLAAYVLNQEKSD